MKNESNWVEITREGSSREGILTTTKAMQTGSGVVMRVEVKLWGSDSVISISNSLTFIPNGEIKKDDKGEHYLF
jgi:hypothetical protein